MLSKTATSVRRSVSVLPIMLVLALLVGCGGSLQGSPAQEDEEPIKEQVEDQAQEENVAQNEAEEEPVLDQQATELAPLHVEGTQLVNDAGNPVQLKGISTHGLSWFPQYVNEQLFRELASDWGANAVRLAMYTAESGGYCADGSKEDLEQLVLDGVRYATDAHLYAIVDWHILSDNNPLDHADEAEDFFARVSATLGSQGNVLYEICNEPNGSTAWADVKTYAERIIPVIRANDPDAVIIVGTPEWSQRVDQAAADPLAFDNVLYTLHFYAATHKDDLRNRMIQAINSGLPVFVSEFGICDASGNGTIDEDSANEWVRAMDQAGVSYLMWNLSNKDESSSAIVSTCSKTSGFATSDLSAAGAWLLGVLQGELSEGEGDVGTAQGKKVETAEPARWGSFTYTLKAVNSWPVDGKTCTQYELRITNEGDVCDSWEVQIPFEGAFEVTDGWNAKFEAKDGALTVTNADYNGHVDKGAGVSDIGFQLIA